MYFITGATGLVGGAIAQRLINEGKEVYALKRPQSNTQPLGKAAEQIRWIEGDLLDSSLLAQALRGMEYVVHAAASVSMHQADKAMTFKTNVDGTANMVNMALEAGVKKFCYISSVAALGIPPAAQRIDEKVQWNLDDTNFVYAKSKHYAEVEVWRGIAEGLPAVILNPSVVLGYSPADRSTGQIFALLKSGLPFYPSGNINLVGIDDLTELVIRLLGSPIHAERFIVSAGSMPYQAFFSQVAQHWGKKAPSIALNKASLSAVFWLSKFANLFSAKPISLPKEVIAAVQSTHTYDSSKIRKALDFEFADLSTTIEQASRQYQA